MTHEGYRTRAASRSELAAVLVVQREAFGRVSSGLGIDPAQLPPLVETLSDLERLYDAGTLFVVAVTAHGQVIGSVRGWLRTDATVEVGRLVVAGDWLRRGVATALMDALEAAFPHALRYELFTGADARVPLSLYAARGYTAFRRECIGPVELVWLEKPGPAA